MKIWFKQKLNWIVMAIAAVVALSFIWTLIPGFSKLPTNVDNMQVAVVDRDNQQISKQMKKGLKDNLPFKEVTAAKTNAGIKRQIKNRDVSMVVIIPKGFSSAVQAGRPVQMKYYRGTANGMIEAMAQKTAVNQINSKVKEQIQSKTMAGMIARQMQSQVASQMQSRVQAQVQAQIQANPQLASHASQIAQQAQKKAQAQAQQQVMARASAAAKSATSQLTSKNEYVGTHHANYKYQQTPMFFNMGQYLGMMLASIVLVILFTSARFAVGNKFTAFMGLQVSGLLLATTTSIIASLGLLCVEPVDHFMSMFGIAWLFDVAVFEISSMLALLCGGLPSIIIQLPLFTSQVIAGGAIVPRFAMPSFFKWLSNYTPMYQGTQAISNTMAGIGHMAPFLTSLLWIAIISCVLGLLFVWIGYRGKEAKGLANLVPIKY